MTVTNMDQSCLFVAFYAEHFFQLNEEFQKLSTEWFILHCTVADVNSVAGLYKTSKIWVLNCIYLGQYCIWLQII